MHTPDNYMPDEVIQPHGLAVVGNVLRAAWEDFRESEHKLRFLAATAMTGAVEAISVSKAATVGIPATAFEILHNTDNAPLAAIAAGGMFGAWSWGVATALDTGVRHYPKSLRIAESNLPKLSSTFFDSLPGFEPPEPAEQPDKSRLRQLGGQITTHARRGLTALGLGSGFYVVAANLEGRPRSAIRRLNAGVGVDCAAVSGSLMLASGEAILKLGDSHPALADAIQEQTGNKILLTALAGSLVVGQGLYKSFQHRKAASVQQ